MMALAGIKVETLVSESNALTTRPPCITFYLFERQNYVHVKTPIQSNYKLCLWFSGNADPKTSFSDVFDFIQSSGQRVWLGNERFEFDAY